MPSKLDPAYEDYLPPSQWNETPTQGMKRIELEMQDRPNTQRGRLSAGAGRSLEGYNARVAAQGPFGGSVMVAADPITGKPVMVGGQAQAGPLSYQVNKPTFKGAPVSQTVGIGGQPFDADTYFGLSAQQSPGQGRTYGANVSQGGEDGGWSAYGGYNPTNRSANVGGSYQANFSDGGRALVGHTTAAGEPVSLEEHKGQIRHRADSGNSRMAADYGYIDNSRKDHDGMKTDAFVGPYHDSKKVFVVNQQHPHTGKFNEHKVLLGYKDRAHALRDYAHSFSDGLGHKRIQSVVEMGTHELKDWLKKSHTAPLRKAEGGPVHMADGGDPPPRPLTIRRGVTPQGLAAEMVPPEEQGAIEGQQAASPSLEGVGEGLNLVGEGVAPLAKMTGEYLKSRFYDPGQQFPQNTDTAPRSMQAGIAGIQGPEATTENMEPSPFLQDVGNAASALYRGITEDPAGAIGGLNQYVGAGQAIGSISNIKDAAKQAKAAGDMPLYNKLSAMATLSAMGILIPGAGGVAEDIAKTAVKDAAREAVEATGKFAGKAGTSSADMAALLDRVRGTKLGELVDRYQNLPADEAHAKLYSDLANLAQEGEPGRLWYEKSSKRILDYTGGDKDAADKLAQLIAIYSPQTTVDVNTANAMKAYNRAKTGEQLWNGQIIDRDKSFDTIKAANDYVRSLGGSDAGVTKVPLDDSGKRFLIAQHGGSYDNIATADRDLKAHLVMNEDIPFEGRKTNNFYNNLMVHVDPSRLQGSTQDLWMARAFGFLDDAVGNTGKYDYMERVTADLAKQLGWEPHQVQAAIWTAMKTRQEGVSDAVKQVALDNGLATMVPNPLSDKGGMKFQVNDGAENQYAALMREKAMGAQVTPETIKSSARDFSDFLDQNLAHVSWETAPSNKIAHLQGFDDLPPQAKAEYHMDMSKALQDEDGKDLISKYLGVLSPGATEAPGYWEGRSNPATMTQLGTTRVKAAGKAPTMDQSSRALADLDASIRGLVLKQDGVGYHRPYYDPQISKANGMEYTFDKPLSSNDVVNIGKELDNRFGGSVGLMPVGPNKVRIIDFGWNGGEGMGDVRQVQAGGKGGKKSYFAGQGPLPQGVQELANYPTAKVATTDKGKQVLTKYTDSRDFHNAVDEVMNKDTINGNAEYRVFASDGDLVGNDWKANPNGEDYIQRIGAAGRPDVLEHISTVLAPRVQAVDERFAAKYGLPRDTRLEDALRNLHNQPAQPKAAGGPVTGYAKGGEVRNPDLPVTVPPQDLPRQVRNVAHDIASIAHRDKLDQRHLAYLLKVASGMYMPADRAMHYAQQIMTGDVDGIIQRFKSYRGSIVTFARLNQMMGGKHKFMGSDQMGKHMQRMKGLDSLQRTKDHVDSAMDSDVVKSRPVMARALKKLSKRI